MDFPTWRTGDKMFKALQNDGKAETITRITQAIHEDHGAANNGYSPEGEGSFLISRRTDQINYLLLDVRPTDWVVRVAPGQYMVMLDEDFRAIFTVGGNW